MSSKLGMLLILVLDLCSAATAATAGTATDTTMPVLSFNPKGMSASHAFPSALADPQQFVSGLWVRETRTLVVSSVHTAGKVDELTDAAASACDAAATAMGHKGSCVVWNTGLPEQPDMSAHPRFIMASALADALGCSSTHPCTILSLQD